MNASKTIQSIYDFSFEELQQYILDLGESAYRAEQIWRGLYCDLFTDWEDFSTLPKQLRNILKSRLIFHNLVPVKTISSPDNSTQKILFHLPDGSPVESVLMYDGKRITICLSTQSGCAMGCTFCATGKLGLLKNLTSGEIVEQVIFHTRELKATGQSISNIVFMGMGEPFNNYESLLFAIHIFKDGRGLKIGSRRITVSTIGIIPYILRFAEKEPQVNLAISLHAPNDALRSFLVPINKRYPITELISECHAYIQKTHRRISFEYVLIDGVNDSMEDARQLSILLKGLLCHINLIPLNPIDGSVQKPPNRNSILSFCKLLENNNLTTTIRKSMGSEINAACGQLSGQKLE